MINKLPPFTSQNKSRSFWWFGLKLGILAAIALWWWLQDDLEDRDNGTYDRFELAPDVPDDTSSANDKVVETVPDDITEIDGIGPKYAQVLKAAGVVSFVQLALLHPDDIRNIFKAAGERVPNPNTWPKQAAQRTVI